MSVLGIQYPEKTVYQMVQAAARKYPRHTAVRFFGKRITYARLLERIDAAAAGLWQLGIRKGDRVTVCMPNTPQAVDCFYGLSRIGAVANVIHPLSAPQELQFYLELSQSKAILTLEPFYPQVAAAAGDRMVFVGGIRDDLPFFKKLLYRERRLSAGGHIPWKSLYRQGAGLPPEDGDYKACACILYSGGTTGKPKGVCLSSKNFNAAALQTLAASGYENVAGMKMLAVMPMFHGFGLGVGIHTPLIAGACCVLVPRFRLKSFIRLLKREKPDFLPGVPTLFDALVDSPVLKNTDLSFLKGIFCGGDSLSPELKSRVDAFLQAHGCVEQIREGYGMTETVSVSCLTPRHTGKEGTIGLPFPDTQFQMVVPGTTRPVPVGQSGEICVSGPSVMLGYLNEPEETAQALKIHEDGLLWLHTADLGSMDTDGYVRFLQRLRRLIITNGYNVYPTQLEAVISSHPQVSACCVVGIPDPHRGQLVKAFVVPTEAPSEALRQSILDHCAQRIARYAIPKQLEFRRELPKTKLGKIDFTVFENQH